MSTVPLKTNRDLYRLVADLKVKHANNQPSLHDYLVALRTLATQHASEEGISLAQLGALLSGAFHPQPEGDIKENTCGDFQAWQTYITKQISDLDDMRSAGLLDGEERSFGVDSPSGGRWFNFEPVSFLECAVIGSVGGWEDGDDMRATLAGEVVPAAEGSVTIGAEEDAGEDTVFEMGTFTWGDFEDFLWAGQTHE